jgi:succinoglycan biosynthesis transport protein ExoP
MSTVAHQGLPADPTRELAVVPPYASAHSPRATIFFSDLLAAINRRLVPALIAFAAAAGFIVFGSQLLPAKYTGVADVMIDTRQREVVKLEAVLSGLPPDSAVVDSEVEVVRSRGLADAVVTKLGLDRDPEFGFDPSVQTTPAARHQQAVDLFLTQLGVRRIGLTYVIEIGFRSLDAVKESRI